MSRPSDHTSRRGSPLPPLPHPPPLSEGPPPRPPRKRPTTLHDFWPTDRPVKAGRLTAPPPTGGCQLHITPRRRPRDPPTPERIPKLPRPSAAIDDSRTPHGLRVPDGLTAGTPPPAHPAPLHFGRRRTSPSPTTSPAEVLYMGAPDPPVLQTTSPSGDVRLTLRRYATGDSLDSPHLLLRMDLRIHPRDLHSIPHDGHCGYHSLAVLSHPLYPRPPPPSDCAALYKQLLARLQTLPTPALREAATGALLHPPPRILPRLHWFHAEWLGLIPDLPPIGCLARLEETVTPPSSLSPWYYCTALSCATSQLEHALTDLLRLADSGRLMLHANAHFHPVTPPPFFSLALRQCGALLQQQLGGSLPFSPPPAILAPPAPPSVQRYTATRSLPGGIHLGLGQSTLSPEAQWGVIALKSIPRGACIMEYGGPHRTQAWLDTPGQNLTYVWSDLDAHEALSRTGQHPVIIDANPAYTDSWGGRINDGFVQGANVEIRRDRHSNKVHIWALEPITPGTELTVHYGPDYWQEHFFSCPTSVQQGAAQCYSLVVVAGRCYQTKELRKLRTQGQAYQSRGIWFLGARGTVPIKAESPAPSPPPRRVCVPLPYPEPHITTPSPALHCATPLPGPSAPVTPQATVPDTESGPTLPGASTPAPPPEPVPFLWLMDLSGSIIENTTQAFWGVSSLGVVARFLHDPTNCNMSSLLHWASRYGSPARFHLHLATPQRAHPPTPASALGILAADYGLKARSASGIRGDDVEDWPNLSDPADVALLKSHISRLKALPSLGWNVRDLLEEGLSDTAPAYGTLSLQGTTLLDLGDPRLPYSLFEPTPSSLDGRAHMLPLRLTGDPRLPRTRDHAWTDLLLIGSDPHFATLEPTLGLTPLNVPNPPRMGERIRWALHSLCQATLEAVATPLPRLRRLPRLASSTLLPAPEPRSDPTLPHPPASTPLVATHVGGPDPPVMPPATATAPARAAPSLRLAPLHTGVPLSSPWMRRGTTPTYGTLWSSLQCGPHHVALAGFTTTLTPNLRIGSLNTNGLTQPKLTELLWYMRLEQLDVFFLLDTRATLRAGKFLGRQARSFLGPGSVAQVSPARPAHPAGTNSRHGLVGGQLLLIGPAWGSALKSSHKDPTGLGVLTEVVLGCTGGDILLMGTYFPCPHPQRTDPPASSNKLWDKLQQWLHKNHIADSPSQYLADLITLKSLRHCSRGSATTTPIVIVGGDFNATWSDHLGPLKGLGGWASAASLLSPIAQASADGPDPLFSYYQGVTPKSLIDHLLLSSSCQGHIAYAGVGCGAFFSSISDHRPVLLGLHLHNGQPALRLGHQATDPPRRPVDLDLVQQPQVAAYRAHTEGLLTNLNGACTPEDASAMLRSLCLDSAAWVQAQGLRTATKSWGRRHYDGWSPPAMALKAQLVALTTIQGHLQGCRGHSLWNSQARMDQNLPGILATWEGAVRRLTWTSPPEASAWLDYSGFPPSFWRTTTLRDISRPGFCANLIRKVKHRLHGRFRTELRRQISAASRARESLREQGKLKRVIASILQKDTELYGLHTLQLEQGMLTDAPTIHNMVTEHFHEWYKAPGPPIDWPSLLRDHSAFLAHATSKLIPPHLSQLLWDAFTQPLQLSTLQQELQTALGSPPSLAEFKAAIHFHKGSTAPGASGLTYNMVKGWPPSVVAKVHELLTLAFSGPTPSWLQWGWLCPKPKDPENGITLDGLRPLMLLEVLRKLWIWIHVRKIVRLWETHRALTPSQHGFRRGHGTDSALVVHINCLEHAAHTNTPLFLSSWDIRRAFDSVSKEAMDASWRRLGVPAHTAHWIAHLDDNGPTAVRSPWALQAWREAGYQGLSRDISLTSPSTFVRERGTPQGDVSSPHAWTAFFDIALRALSLTDPSSHFQMATARDATTTVSDLGYADDLVSLSSSLAGLQLKADLMSAFALLFDLTISAPKLRAACLGPSPPDPTLVIHGPGWTPTPIPIRTQGTIKILGLTIDISTSQTTQPQLTRAHLTQAATILGHQQVADTAALVTSISTMAKAAYTSQFLPWSTEDLLSLDIPLNRAFRRLLHLPPTHPNALLYINTTDGGLGLPRLSDQINLRKWSILGRLKERGGLPALALEGLLHRATTVSGGQFLIPHQGDFIGPHSATPVWGSSLGSFGPDTTLHLAPTQGRATHPLLRPITPLRSDNFALLRTLRRLDLSSWADLTSRAPDGTRTWLDLPLLLPELPLPSFPPIPQPWPGDPAATRSGQFWRLRQGAGDWAWGGIYQILNLAPGNRDLSVQRWLHSPSGPGKPQVISRAGHPTLISTSDFLDRCTHRILVARGRSQHKGTIRVEFPDSPNLTPLTPSTWVDRLPQLTTAHSWSVYADASWRLLTPLQAQAVFGLQGSHHGRGALFLSADLPDWCSDITAVCFEIPPALRALGGTAHVAELLAIQAGLHLLSTRRLHGTVYSDCLSAVKKITRRWSPGQGFQEAGAALVSSCRAYLSDAISLKWTKGHPERSAHPPSTWSRQQWGIYLADAVSQNRDIRSLPHSPIPILQTHSVSLHDILSTANPSDSWQWTSPDGSPPLGNLRTLLSHHRVLAYRANRDRIRADRGAPPIWLDTFQSVGPAAWVHRSQPLRKRVQALRSLWDLRWHGENRAVAARSADPQVSACPICHRHWTQAHVLCDCPSTSGARGAGILDLTVAISHLPVGPMLELGRHLQGLLLIPNQPSLMARRWSGQWDQVAICSLQPAIARCSRKQLKAVMRHIGRITCASTTACWKDFIIMARDLSPPLDGPPSLLPLVDGQMSTIDWDPRLGEDHG